MPYWEQTKKKEEESNDTRTSKIFFSLFFQIFSFLSEREKMIVGDILVCNTIRGEKIHLIIRSLKFAHSKTDAVNF